MDGVVLISSLAGYFAAMGWFRSEARCAALGSFFDSFLEPLFFTTRSREKVVLNGSWAVQDEFQDRLQPS